MSFVSNAVPFDNSDYNIEVPIEALDSILVLFSHIDDYSTILLLPDQFSKIRHYFVAKFLSAFPVHSSIVVFYLFLGVQKSVFG